MVAIHAEGGLQVTEEADLILGLVDMLTVMFETMAKKGVIDAQEYTTALRDMARVHEDSIATPERAWAVKLMADRLQEIADGAPPGGFQPIFRE